MNPSDVQQLAQAFVASWETQLARLLREPHTLAAMMAAAQPQQSPFTAAPFGAAASAANPFAAFMGSASHAQHQPTDFAAHAAAGNPSGGNGAQRLAALERELERLRDRVAELEQQLVEPAPRPAAKRAASPAGAGSGKASGAKSKRAGGGTKKVPDA